MTKFKHELGKLGKDKITNFQGIIISRCEYLTGCNRYGIQPIELQNGTLVDSVYFDEECIDVIGSGILPEKVKGEKKGAYGRNPYK